MPVFALVTYVTRARGSHALSAERSAITPGPFLARPTTKQIIVADTRLTICIVLNSPPPKGSSAGG